MTSRFSLSHRGSAPAVVSPRAGGFDSYDQEQRNSIGWPHSWPGDGGARPAPRSAAWPPIPRQRRPDHDLLRPVAQPADHRSVELHRVALCRHAEGAALLDTAIRQINPKFIVLHYQLAVGCGTADFIDGNTWTNDFATVSHNNSWFLLDGSSRIEQTAWDWYVMNIVFSNGTPASGFPNYWTTAALQRLNDNQNDGVFAIVTRRTSCSARSSGIFLVQQRHHLLEQLDSQPEPYGAYCASTLHSQPEKFYYLPNLGALITGWDTTNYGVGDGGMNEGFAIPAHPAVTPWATGSSRWAGSSTSRPRVRS